MSNLWSGRFDSEPNAAVFDFGASFRFDRRLFEDDVIGSLAWAEALKSAGALSASDAAAIGAALRDILAKGQADPTWVSGSDEDVHSFVERQLVERIGDAGRRLHTGRSRNEQVSLDLRLVLRRRIVFLERALQRLIAPDPVVRDLQAETAELGQVAGMQIGDDQGQLLTMLARLTGARRAVEVGTFTGYSSMCIARGLAEGGSLLCCDVSAEWTEIGRRAWAAAGLADRIELRIGPALDTLRALPAVADIDLVFIDADKPGYAAYWAELVPRVRPGGLLLADNVLWSGQITDLEVTDANITALRTFNDLVASDDRVDTVVLTAFDGLTVARRR